MSDHDKIVILVGRPDSGFFARLMKLHDNRRALIISPTDEETALQLLERLRKEGATVEAINSHEGLQALKEAWGGMELPAATPRNGATIRMAPQYDFVEDLRGVPARTTIFERDAIPEACTNSTPEEVLIKRGFVAPKHHMHLSASGIPTKRGRKR